MKTSSTGEIESETTRNHSSIEEIKKWRPVFYKLAWFGFSPPDEQTINKFGLVNIMEGMLEVSKVYGLEMEDRFSAKKLEAKNGDERSLLRDLEAEFVRLFIADVGGARVQPYGSFYIDDEINGKSTRKVADTYCRVGFKKADNYSDLPDHFSVELEYMYRLSQSESSDSLEPQRNFYDEYISPWYEKFTSEVHRETEHWFYDLLSQWTSKGLKKDREALRDIITGTCDEGEGQND